MRVILLTLVAIAHAARGKKKLRNQPTTCMNAKTLGGSFNSMCKPFTYIPVSDLGDERVYGPYGFDSEQENGFLVYNGGDDRMNLLHVFLPGTSSLPVKHSQYLKFSAELGYPTIGLAYNWAGPVGYVDGTCADSEDHAQCWESVHDLILEGKRSEGFNEKFGKAQYQKHIDKYLDDEEIYNEHQCVKNRLVLLLKMLAKKERMWGRFLDGDEPRWSSIVLSGHSQGAVHTGWWSWKYRLARGIMLAGPAETNQKWPKASEPATPREDIYALCHHKENQQPQMTKMWQLMRLPRQNTVQNTAVPENETPGGYHNVIAYDVDVKVDRSRPLWQYFLGRDDTCRNGFKEVARGQAKKRCEDASGCMYYMGVCVPCMDHNRKCHKKRVGPPGKCPRKFAKRCPKTCGTCIA